MVNLDDPKDCPRCSERMNPSVLHSLPATKDPNSSAQGEAFSLNKALSVIPYVCSQCGLVELYHSA